MTTGDPTRFVATAAIRRAVAGRDTEVLEALGINWRAGRPHIECPYPDHCDGNPSWRWNAHKNRAFCTCIDGSHSALDVVMKVEGLDFDAAKVRAAELLGRTDLIRNGNARQYQGTDAASLLSATAARRDDRLPVAYLAHRLGVTTEDVPLPGTHMVGLKGLPYYDPPADGAKPTLVGTYPCAVFGTVAADGRTHAHRIYLAPGGAGKADLGIAPEGQSRNPKKSARAGGDNTSGRSVLWGDAGRAPHVIVTEGIETGAAVALALKVEIEAGEVAVAAAISATGVEAFQLYPATRRVTIAADRDEAPKNGKPGSRRGEEAARKFGQRHSETLAVAIALPGQPGESTDFLDILRRDGVGVVRAGILEAAPFAPPAEACCPSSIRVMGGDLAPAVRAALSVLASEPDPHNAVYSMSGRLVRPARARSKIKAANIRRPMDALTLRAVDAEWLGFRLSEKADWYKIGADGKRKPVDPPERVCRSVLAAAPWDGLPHLAGIIEAPTIRPDGSLLTEPGYDPATGLLFDPGHTTFPTIPIEPTRAQAEAALQLLAEPIKDFPFANDASRSVSLSAFLTGLMRRTLPHAPLFAYDAPKMASGKTLLASLVSFMATGRMPYITSHVTDPDEERKRITAILLEGPLSVVIDNITSTFRSNTFCTVLTEAAFSERLLGATQNVTCPTNVMFSATGNNLRFAGDISTRAIICRLDPKCERPEELEFDITLREWVPARRGELVAAALTIIRGYIAAGSPKQPVPNFARFEEWQRLCRHPLVWLGCADPCATRESIEGLDPVREMLRWLLTEWRNHFGDDRATVKDAIRAAATAAAGTPDEEGNPAFQSALEEVAGEKGGINSRRLGNFISAHKDRIEDKLRFVRESGHGGSAYWRAMEGENGRFGSFGRFCPTNAGENGKNLEGEKKEKEGFRVVRLGETDRTDQTYHSDGATNDPDLAEWDL